MPTYEYHCLACKHRFDEFLAIKDRSTPEKKACSECGKKKVKQGFFTPPVGGHDATVKPDSNFKEILNSMKNNGAVPKEFHDNLDRAANRDGRSYKTQ
jgi:putative FmdB family regulatory protein